MVFQNYPKTVLPDAKNKAKFAIKFLKERNLIFEEKKTNKTNKFYLT